MTRANCRQCKTDRYLRRDTRFLDDLPRANNIQNFNATGKRDTTPLERKNSSVCGRPFLVRRSVYQKSDFRKHSRVSFVSSLHQFTIGRLPKSRDRQGRNEEAAASKKICHHRTRYARAIESRDALAERFARARISRVASTRVSRDRRESVRATGVSVERTRRPSAFQHSRGTRRSVGIQLAPPGTRANRAG